MRKRIARFSLFFSIRNKYTIHRRNQSDIPRRLPNGTILFETLPIMILRLVNSVNLGHDNPKVLSIFLITKHRIDPGAPAGGISPKLKIKGSASSASDSVRFRLAYPGQNPWRIRHRRLRKVTISTVQTPLLSQSQTTRDEVIVLILPTITGLNMSILVCHALHASLSSP